MKPLLLAFSALFICSTASADMVEIKGEGFFNGTIESEDKDQVTFKDAGGKVRTLAKSDVLFMERQAEASAEKKAAIKAGQALKKIAAEKAAVKGPSAPANKKPAAAKKKEPAGSSSRASSGGDATGAIRAMARAQRAVAANQARMEKALREGDSLAEEKKDRGKGRFSSL